MDRPPRSRMSREARAGGAAAAAAGGAGAAAMGEVTREEAAGAGRTHPRDARPPGSARAGRPGGASGSLCSLAVLCSLAGQCSLAVLCSLAVQSSRKGPLPAGEGPERARVR
jgi:hypothetical protein